MHTGRDQDRRPPDLPRFVVVMGVCGVGKTTTARALAARTGGVFLEADDLHPETNRARMAAGRPLDDGARWPWLDRVAETAAALAETGDHPVVVACSALRPSYRDVLRRRLGTLVFLHLDAPRAEIRRRLEARAGHFMPPSLLDSQLADLEIPGTEGDLRTLLVVEPAATVVERALAAVAGSGPARGQGRDDGNQNKFMAEEGDA